MKKIYNILALAAVTTGLSSCVNNWLDQTPSNGTPTSSAITNYKIKPFGKIHGLILIIGLKIFNSNILYNHSLSSYELQIFFIFAIYWFVNVSASPTFVDKSVNIFATSLAFSKFTVIFSIPQLETGRKYPFKR